VSAAAARLASRLKTLVDRFAGRNAALPTLDVLASSASPAESLENRLNWLVDLAQWIRRPGLHEEQSTGNTEIIANIKSGRVRRFFDVLDRNPEWKKQVAQTLRSIIRETSALELFCATGLPRQFGLLSETFQRIGKKMIPSPPASAELGVLFDRMFPHRGDARWVQQLDETTLRRFQELLDFEVSDGEKDWNSLEDDLEDALFHLAAQLQVSGGTGAIRSRTNQQNLRESPFFKLGTVLRAVMTAKEKSDAETLIAELNYLRAQIDACHRAREEVLGHLENRGVSTEVVYQLAFIEASLRRFEALLELAFNPNRKMTDVSALVATLVRENRARESVVNLIKQNFALLTRKIVERSAETGRHYFARTPGEYAEMLRRAGGGGVIMAFTTWFKTIILNWHLAELMQGLAASLNYSLGFVAIQLTGSTLATKQPANTAPALAARMHHVREPKAMQALVDEIVLLIRSQFASIVGNLALVVPAALALHAVVLWVRGAPPMSPERAIYTIHSVSILGPTMFYGGFTGVLLWASSLVAAWADNWFVCNHIGEALETDRRLVRVLGTSRTQRFARFWKRNIAGLGGNISFGFMLGIIPELAKFAGVPLDIRHVTLSSSLLTMAVGTLGPEQLLTSAFWLAVIGVMSVGVMNVAVSFSLAMFVAIRARGVQAPERRAIYLAILKRAWEQPLSFILPVGSTATVVEVEPIAEKVK
jgi:site-specific recombinase